jgi:hypothetical protein
VKTIELTQGQVALVDDEDYGRIARHSWHAVWIASSKTFYAIRRERDARGKKVALYMHREVMRAAKGELVDHRDHNGIDNRRSNLRVCSHKNNIRNMRKIKDSSHTSLYKGVGWHAQRGKWRAYIVVDAKQRSLGLFADERRAAAAYNRAAREAFGEFAYLNEVSEAS